jgi:citrate synthase
MIAMSSPEALQAAVAAGLLGVGSQFIGTMENTALLLADLIAAPGGVQARARAVVAEHRRDHKPVPGFGHPLHRPDDPRSPKLIALARDQGVPGRHIAALEALAAAVDDGYGRHITINATGAVAAVLGEIAIPTEIMRGIAVISRAAGLVGHIREEREHPAARFIWELTEREVAYAGPSARPGPNDKEGD